VRSGTRAADGEATRRVVDDRIRSEELPRPGGTGAFAEVDVLHVGERKAFVEATQHAEKEFSANAEVTRPPPAAAFVDWGGLHRRVNAGVAGRASLDDVAAIRHYQKVGKPVARGQRIVVGEGDPRCAGGARAGVAIRRRPEAWSRDEAGEGKVAGQQLCCPDGVAVVRDDHFVRVGGERLRAGREAREAGAELRRTVTSRDDDADAWRGGGHVLGFSERKSGHNFPTVI